MDEVTTQKQTEDTGSDLQDLEKAFQEEVVSAPEPTPEAVEMPTPQPATGGFSNTKQTLEDTDAKIAAKVASLKEEAKSELEQLKTLKNTIAKKIADVKELEETREKIKKELDKIKSLESEVDSITKEAKNELGES
jgi:DNA repair exonuclease SbcCD ATPase subunit